MRKNKRERFSRSLNVIYPILPIQDTYLALLRKNIKWQMLFSENRQKANISLKSKQDQSLKENNAKSANLSFKKSHF